MNKKGLSPVIASVLLVALVLVLATIIYLWARTMIPETAEKFGMPIEDSCPNVNFVASLSISKDSIIIQNNGNVPIQGISYAIEGAGALEYEELMHDVPVVGGGTSSFALIPGDNPSGKNVRVTPILLGTKTGTGRSTAFVCDEIVKIIAA